MILIIVILNVTWTYFVFCTSMLPGWQKGELNYKEIRKSMKARSGQNHDSKIAPQVSFNPTAANIMDMLCIFVITKQYFFQRVCNYF